MKGLFIAIGIALACVSGLGLAAGAYPASMILALWSIAALMLAGLSEKK